MKSEALRNLKTMRQIKSGPDAVLGRSVRTTNSLSRLSGEIELLESQRDPRLEALCENERRRFVSRERAVDRVRNGFLKCRRKLALVINRNRAIMELRKNLQNAQRMDSLQLSANGSKGSIEEKATHLEIRY